MAKNTTISLFSSFFVFAPNTAPLITLSRFLDKPDSRMCISIPPSSTDSCYLGRIIKYPGISMYVQMIENLIFPDHFVINSVLKACGLELDLKMDTVCWTTMIDGLVRNGEMNKAEYFRGMQMEGVRANEFTGMKEREVSTYNSMIVGFALNGKSVEAVETFRRTINEGTKPNNVTFVGVLNACSHGGLVDFRFEIFQCMQVDYGIEPQIKHYVCIVDLLGRVGRVDEAYKFIQTMKVTLDHIIWGKRLSACKIHQEFKLGKRVVKILLNHEFCDTGTYVFISNFYTCLGKWEEAHQARGKLKENGFQKEPGCSSVEVNNDIHEFLLGDIRHPKKNKAIYRKLEEMERELRLEGYYPEVEVVSQDITGQEKQWACHT
ncbi:hypothetical protein BUALT_Bualt13G0110900 [Buddleja alternifolia]|uniref:Pentatricopeptide repeat-containing protein n=1 Tax=Buddleja alternifolia TaxID=168488 RepID=A0AAV6WU81_9LAMI|nr:hypothetical protein BUALT_Bualt13G0110900 [Buddleja alternifolia]